MILGIEAIMHGVRISNNVTRPHTLPLKGLEQYAFILPQIEEDRNVDRRHESAHVGLEVSRDTL